MATITPVLTANPSPLELRVFHALNLDGGPVVDALARVLSSPAFGFAVAAILLALAASRFRWPAAVAGAATALSLSDGVGSQLLKPWFARERPCYALHAPAVRWIGAAADSGSMQSLHAANFFALAVLAAGIDRRLTARAFVLAIAVALSRVYLGVHWPWDVVAGACWGAIAGAVGVLVLRRLRPTREAVPEGR